MIIAIAKGRVFEASLNLLKEIGLKITEDLSLTRKLLLSTNHSDIQIMIVRSSDVPTYVENGVATYGIVGKDVLLEHPLGSECLEMIDLNIAHCRICLAAKKQFDLNKIENQRLKIATKYPLITKNYFLKQNLQVDIVKLSGAMELAPNVGLSDGIVDLVDSGRTLKANQLFELNTIARVSSRLIVNSIHLKTQFKKTNHWIVLFAQAVHKLKQN